MKKRTLAAILAAAMTLSLAACGGSSADTTTAATTAAQSDTEAAEDESTEAESADTEAAEETTEAEEQAYSIFSTSYTTVKNTVKSDDTLTVAFASEPDNLLTLSGTQENSIVTLDNLMLDTLVKYDHEKQELVPNLATSWEWLDDQHIQFTLRDDVKNVDGTDFTAADVVYTVGLAAEKCGSLDLGKYFDTAETKAVDDHTVIIGLNVVSPGFLEFMSYPQFGIVSESAVEAAGGYDALGRNPVVGTGKYIFSKWEAGQYIEFTRNEDYWNTDYVGYYKTIRITFVNDNATRLMAVQSGDADVALDIPAAIVSPMIGSDVVKVNLYDSERVNNIYLNCSQGIFADEAVRKAVYYAINKEDINSVATTGLGTVSDALISKNNKYYTDVYADEPWEQNIEKAKQILADAGYTGTLQCTAIAQQKDLPVFTVIQENLREIGIEMTLDSTDSGTYVSRAKEGDYDLIYGSQDLSSRLPVLLNPLYGPTIERGVIGGPKYQNDEMDAAIELARTTADEDEAKEAIKTVLEIIRDNCIMVGVNTGVNASVMNNSLDGMCLTANRQLFDLTYICPVQ